MKISLLPSSLGRNENCALQYLTSFLIDDVLAIDAGSLGFFRAPEQQTIEQLQEALEFYKNQPLERVGVYRRALKFSRVPRPIRRLFWWSTLNVSGFKRAKRFGTFGLTSTPRRWDRGNN